MRYLIIVAALIVVAAPAHAFVDAMVTGVTESGKAAAEEAHRRFVELKWVENIRKLNQNYTASKNFYDQMEKITQHRGGVGGYAQEKLSGNFNQIGQDAVWKLDAHMKSDPDDTAYVRKWIAATDKRVEQTFDYSKKLRELGQKKTAEADDLAAAAAKPNLTSHEYDSIILRAALAQTAALTLMNKNLELLLEMERAKSEDAWRAAKERQKANDKVAKTHAEAFDKMKKMKVGPKKDPWPIFLEVPK